MVGGITRGRFPTNVSAAQVPGLALLAIALWVAVRRAGRNQKRRSDLVDGGSSSYNGYMKEVSSRIAKNQFGQLLESAQRGPVRVTRRGRPVGVLLSEEQYQRLRGVAWDRLANTVDSMRREAADKGLTEDRLAELLADES